MIAETHKTADPVALEPLSADSIRDFLAKQGASTQYRIDVLPTVTSTNDYLAELGLAGTGCVAVCIADQQTQGKGRFSHSWWSPAGVNLYLSMQWGLQQWRTQYEVLGLWLLIAIAQLLEQLGVDGVRLKWPNDICVTGKKLGGILIERKASQVQHSLIIGVGLNVAMSQVREFQETPEWVDLLNVHPDWRLDRNELAAQVIEALKSVLDTLDDSDPEDLCSAWGRYDSLSNQRVGFLYHDRPMYGEVKGIDAQGCIVMRVNGEDLAFAQCPCTGTAVVKALLDLGNSRCKFGILKPGEADTFGALPYRDGERLEVIASVLQPYDQLDRIIVCSVLGLELNERLQERFTASRFYFLNPSENCFGVTSAYEDPGTLGADRLAALIAAKVRYPGRTCIVDCGTAVTVDALDQSGVHRGGVIFPGFGSMRAALDVDTVMGVEEEAGSLAVPATLTRDAIYSGCLSAVAGGITQAIDRMQEGGIPFDQIILTGGDAELLIPLLAQKVIHEPHWVLEGLRHVSKCLDAE